MNWLKSTDYKIQSNIIFRYLLIVQVAVSSALLIVETIVDFEAWSQNAFLFYFVASLLIAIHGFIKSGSQISRLMTPLLSFITVEYLFYNSPHTFHFILYWFSLIPIVALILQGLYPSLVWAGIILTSFVYNSYYINLTSGNVYDVSIRSQPTFFAVVIFLGVVLSFIYLLYVLLSNAYRKYRERNETIKALMKQLKNQNLELALKSDEIAEMYGNLQNLNSQLVISNDSLETKVKERTEELINQNNKLKEYAFVNSHLLRSPLSSILGISNLLQSKKTPIDDQELFKALYKSTDDLDQIVRGISAKLEDGSNLIRKDIDLIINEQLKKIEEHRL